MKHFFFFSGRNNSVYYESGDMSNFLRFYFTANRQPVRQVLRPGNLNQIKLYA
jgi:hypothetical protein